MSTLQKRLKRPETWLVIFGVIAAIAVLDSLRSPERQVSARIYVVAVHAYQHYGRAISSRLITCRYEPTCSEYSIAAVRRYGIRRGLLMTAERLFACRASVPLGTRDPVP